MKLALGRPAYIWSKTAHELQLRPSYVITPECLHRIKALQRGLPLDFARLLFRRIIDPRARMARGAK